MSSTFLPPQDLEQMLDLSKFLDQVDDLAALVGPDGQTVALPLEAFRVLTDVVHAMTEGKAITVAPVDQLLTTQEAADFLGISRPTFVKLLEDGRIPYETPGAGRHRRVKLHAVLEYQQEVTHARRATLDELTAEAASVGLYDDPPEYGEALAQVRGKRD